MRYQSYERPITFFDLLSSLVRYKWRFLFVTTLMLIVAAAGILLFPKRYESEAKLFVRLGRGSASMDPATFGQTISIQESRESEMNSIVDMLQSRGLAERVVDEIGPERLLKKNAWIEKQVESYSKSIRASLVEAIPSLDESAGEEGSMTADQIEAEKKRDLAIKEFMGDLKVDSPKKSTTISLAFRGRESQLAKDVVTSVIDQYQKMHIDAYRSGGTLQFFDEQFKEKQELLSQSEASLRDKKIENGIVTMQGKQQSLQTEITDVKKMQIETAADLQAARARVAKLERDLATLAKDLVSETTKGMSVDSTEAMRDRLYALEIEEKELAAKYSDSHPRLKRVREQLTSARSVLTEQPRNREEMKLAINPVRLQIENELLLAEASVASLEAKGKALKTLENELTERLVKVNEVEIQTEQLQREIEIGRENHRNYARKLEESRINNALDQQALSNVSVVAPPSFRLKHVSPNRPLLAILGVMISVLCGACVAILSDYAANSRESKRLQLAEREHYLALLERESAEAKAATVAARLAVKEREPVLLTSAKGDEFNNDVVDDSGEVQEQTEQIAHEQPLHSKKAK